MLVLFEEYSCSLAHKIYRVYRFFWNERLLGINRLRGSGVVFERDIISILFDTQYVCVMLVDRDMLDA